MGSPASESISWPASEPKALAGWLASWLAPGAPVSLQLKAAGIRAEPGGLRHSRPRPTRLLVSKWRPGMELARKPTQWCGPKHWPVAVAIQANGRCRAAIVSLRPPSSNGGRLCWPASRRRLLQRLRRRWRRRKRKRRPSGLIDNWNASAEPPGSGLRAPISGGTRARGHIVAARRPPLAAAAAAAARINK